MSSLSVAILLSLATGYNVAIAVSLVHRGESGAFNFGLAVFFLPLAIGMSVEALRTKNR